MGVTYITVQKITLEKVSNRIFKCLYKQNGLMLNKYRHLWGIRSWITASSYIDLIGIIFIKKITIFQYRFSSKWFYLICSFLSYHHYTFLYALFKVSINVWKYSGQQALHSETTEKIVYFKQINRFTFNFCLYTITAMIDRCRVESVSFLMTNTFLGSVKIQLQ